MRIEGLDHLVLTVADISRTCDFYERVLGMEPIVFGEGRYSLAFGAQKINLHEAGREFEPKAATPTPGSADLCFLTNVPVTEVVEAPGVERRRGPRRTREVHGGGRADNVRVLQGPRREPHRDLQPLGCVNGRHWPVWALLRRTAVCGSRPGASRLLTSPPAEQHR
jgi:catechol 2,3-dioxygenase-like lactoylglutathione lyase family enzyme